VDGRESVAVDSDSAAVVLAPCRYLLHMVGGTVPFRGKANQAPLPFLCGNACINTCLNSWRN